MAPRVLIPSHGMPVGGVMMVEKTLRHRLEREQQVRGYLESGLSEEEITNKIYGDLDPRRQRLARQNIRQHLKKLSAER